MTTNQIILIVAVVAVLALIAVLAGGRGGGPRVTVIETKKTDRDGDDA